MGELKTEFTSLITKSTSPRLLDTTFLACAGDYSLQHAKKVVSDSLGLVDFVIGLVNSVLNLPDGQVKFFGEFNSQKNCNQSGPVLQKMFSGRLK